MLRLTGARGIGGVVLIHPEKIVSADRVWETNEHVNGPGYETQIVMDEGVRCYVSETVEEIEALLLGLSH